MYKKRNGRECVANCLSVIDGGGTQLTSRGKTGVGYMEDDICEVARTNGDERSLHI
jgi:hypothetical protein